LQNTPRREIDVPSLRIETLPIESATAKFDLVLGMEEIDGGMRGTIEYSSDLYAPATMERFARHYATFLQAVASDPDQRLLEVSFMSDAERHEIVCLGNPPATAPARVTIDELFEEQVLRSPHALAVAGERESLTYAELNRRANQVAHVLRSYGVGSEEIAAVCVEDGAAMLVAVIGILKAGAAYLPLDTGINERTSFLLADSGARCIVADRNAVVGSLAANAPVVWIDWKDSLLARAPAHAPPDRSGSCDRLAYLIYTSGSTGKPKGVMISQDALVDLGALVWPISTGCGRGSACCNSSR
jgi:non-ribosomal peptide synthetase component F